MIDEERRPLLSGGNDDGTDRQDYHSIDDNRKSSKKWISESFNKSLHERWPMYRITIVACLLYICSVGSVTSSIELVRALACAEYYQNHPPSSNDLYQFSKKEPENDICDLDAIEKRSASVISFVTVFGALTATLSLFIIQPRLHKWGKKSIFLVSVAIILMERVPALFLPLGYPFRSIDEPMSISPTLSMHLFIVFCMFGELLGTELIGTFCMRLFMTEACSTDTKTEGLLLLQLANMISITFGPALTAYLGSLIPFSSAKLIKMIQIFNSSQRQNREDPSIPLPPSRGPIPPVPPSIKVNNVAPFLVSVMTILFTLVIGYILLPKDEKVIQTEQSVRGTEEENKKSLDEPFWWRLIPRKDIDGNRDWRILTIIFVVMCHMGSAYSLTLYLIYFGHAFRWGQESVALLLSWLGIVRLLCLLFITPALIIYFERKVKKPLQIRHLSLEEIKSIAKQAPADEPPIESESEFQPGFVEEEEVDDEGENTTISHSIKGAIVTWRATVDRSVLAISWAFDILGWTLSAVATSFGSSTMLLLSGGVVAFGAAAQGVRQAVDLVIVGDVLARTDEFPAEDKKDGEQGEEIISPSEDNEISPLQNQSKVKRANSTQADELYFALLTFFESFINFVSPIFDTFIYNRTLSTFPAANWLFPALLFSMAFILHFSMPIHRRSSNTGRSIA